MNTLVQSSENDQSPEIGVVLGVLRKANISGILDLNKVAESEHFVFCSKSESICEQDMRKCDRHLSLVCTRLALPMPKSKINYIILGSDEGGNMKGGFPLASENIIVSKKPFHPHEIAHFLVHKYMGYSHVLLDEGLAVLNGWGALEGSTVFEGRGIDEWIKIFEEVNLLPSLKAMFDDFRSFGQDRSYPVAAFICRNILQNYGTPFFRRFFAKIKPEMSFSEIEVIFEEMTHQKIKDIY